MVAKKGGAMFFSSETRRAFRHHMRAACREQLLGLRVLIDGLIQRVELRMERLSGDEESSGQRQQPSRES